MEDNAIAEAATALKTALDGNELGEIYDHIPPRPSYPCVIIAPTSPFIDEPEDETYSELQANFDIWLIGTPGSDNKSMLLSLYKSIAKAITALDGEPAFSFNQASEPLETNFNETKALGSYITVSVQL